LSPAPNKPSCLQGLELHPGLAQRVGPLPGRLWREFDTGNRGQFLRRARPREADTGHAAGNLPRVATQLGNCPVEARDERGVGGGGIGFVPFGEFSRILGRANKTRAATRPCRGCGAAGLVGAECSSGTQARSGSTSRGGPRSHQRRVLVGFFVVVVFAFIVWVSRGSNGVEAGRVSKYPRAFRTAQVRDDGKDLDGEAADPFFVETGGRPLRGLALPRQAELAAHFRRDVVGPDGCGHVLHRGGKGGAARSRCGSAAQDGCLRPHASDDLSAHRPFASSSL
jgi:hypothetical protein